jgi:hypothetical protein
VGIHARLRVAIISPVSTSRTPGMSQALLASMERIRACAIEAAQDLHVQHAGHTMSST